MNPKSILIARLEDMRGTMISRDALQVQNVAEETELTRVIADREIQAVRLTNCSHVIKQILDAMDRVDTDEYGICEDCEEPISSRRLQAIPWASRCVRCQEAADTPIDTKIQRAVYKDSIAA